MIQWGINFIDERHLNVILSRGNGSILYSMYLLFSCMYLYLLLLVIFVVIPNIILLYLNRKNFTAKVLLFSLGVLFLIGVVWDQISVRLGIWSFSSDKIVGLVVGLPVEEYLFFVFVPLLAINIFVLIDRIGDKKREGVRQ
jgi:lycopene cyclase domain-containing protein